MKSALQFLLDRARERSTWLGLTGLLTALGVHLAPEQAEAVVTLGLALAGAIAVFTSDPQ
jgi:hypothetical protein